MAVDTFQASTCPNVFDAGLPSIAYDHLTDREEALRIVATARQQAPIAMGPHAPEVLTYGLVRTALRDARFTTARGLGLRPHTDPGTRSAVVVRPDPLSTYRPASNPVSTA